MKINWKTLTGVVIWIAMTIWYTTYWAFEDSIDLHFEKKNLISEMEWYSESNDELREDRKWIKLKLDIIDNSIQWNKDKYHIAKWKLDLIEGFLGEDN